MDILTSVGSALASTGTPVTPPIINPVSTQQILPSGQTLSVGQAAANAQQGVTGQTSVLGIDLSDPSVNNLIFLLGIAFLIYKYGRKLA